MRRRPPAVLLAALLTAVLVVAGCGSSDDAAPATSAAPTTVAAATAASTTAAAPASTPSASAFPVTVEHALGSSTIDAAPERVVVLGDFADLDSVLALGVTPVAFGYTDAWGTGLAPWQVAAGADRIEQFDASAEIAVEKVVAADPDVIIGMTYLAEPAYAQLSQLAPTIAVPFDITWQEQLAMIAEALGRSDDVAPLEADVAAALDAGAEQLAPFADQPIMVGSYFGDKLYIQGEKSSVTNLLRALGLTVVTTTAEQMAEQSLENIPTLGAADIVLSFATDAEATHTAQDHPLWQALPAVEAGRYTALTGTEARAVSDGFNALSSQQVIDIIVEVVTATANGQGTPLP